MLRERLVVVPVDGPGHHSRCGLVLRAAEAPQRRRLVWVVRVRVRRAPRRHGGRDPTRRCWHRMLGALTVAQLRSLRLVARVTVGLVVWRESVVVVGRP